MFDAQHPGVTSDLLVRSICMMPVDHRGVSYLLGKLLQLVPHLRDVDFVHHHHLQFIGDRQ